MPTMAALISLLYLGLSLNYLLKLNNNHESLHLSFIFLVKLPSLWLPADCQEMLAVFLLLSPDLHIIDINFVFNSLSASERNLPLIIPVGRDNITFCSVNKCKRTLKLASCCPNTQYDCDQAFIGL